MTSTGVWNRGCMKRIVMMKGMCESRLKIITVAIFVLGVQGEWIGRKCCEYALDNECRNTCLQGKSRDYLELHCRGDIESDLFGCIFRHQRKKRCCGKSSNMTTSCQHVCVMSFRAESGPSSDNIKAVGRHCPEDVSQCTKNFSVLVRKSTDDGAICCGRSNSEKCRNDCKRIMRSYLSENEKIDKVVESCGRPVPREPMWRCLMSKDGERSRPAPPPVGPDLQCCSKAISSNCRQLCEKLYSKPWESSLNWTYFQQWCEYNSEESDLNTCLQEVREPCKMGCSGLSFCTHFNDRPTESFHSCNARADNIARMQIREWSNDTIRLPIAEIPVLDIKTCEPEKWKAVACALEIKPCGAKLGDSTICRDDCIALLRECADLTRLERGMTTEWLCDMFSPRHLQHDCISLKKYTTVSRQSSKMVKITQPCSSSPCKENQYCVVNRDLCKTDVCPSYKCLPGCRVGDVADFLVHVGQRAKIPDLNRGEGCFRACACTTTGRLQFCTDLPCMDASKSCMVVGQVKLHASHFKIDCNFCSCYNGNITCTKRQCVSSDETDDNNRDFTGLPCNCESHFLPVCAPNGRTYASVCLARCMDHAESDIDFGPCNAKDPCKFKPCKRNERCMKASRVCVTSPKTFSCPQYECVASFSRCLKRRMTRDAYASDGHHYVNHRRLNSAGRWNVGPSLFLGYDIEWDGGDPVCDTEGVEYDSICHLRKKHRSTKLAYRGRCEKHCDVNEDNPVCGQDTVTYENKCTAASERVLVDYDAPCHVANFQETRSKKISSCVGVTCQGLSNPDCEPLIPPGACCPVCGGMLRVLYSQRHVDAVAQYAIQGPVTVRDFLRSLRRHINVKECDIFGHLTMESDIAVLVVPIVHKPTILQVEACRQESQRLARFINEKNPIFTSDVILSTLTAAEVREEANGASSYRIKLDLNCVADRMRKLLWRSSKQTQFGENSSVEDKDNLASLKAFLHWIAGICFLHYMFDKCAYSFG